MNATTEYRYPGIQPFSGRQKELFFGRDDDREKLLSLLLLEKLTVLFGKSGYGKSSLLNAGIAPGLEKESCRGKREYTPVFIRFHSRIGNEQYDWFDWFVFQLEQQTPPIDPLRYEQRRFLPRTLWGELKRRQSHDNQVFVLLFDQFEEIFTYPPGQIAAFKQQLAHLLYADIPEYLEHHEDTHPPEEAAWMSRKLDTRALFSIRADRLSELDQLKDSLPAILNKRYELRALTREQAQEALQKPAALPDAEGFVFKSRAFNWQLEAIEKVLSELADGKQGRPSGIEAFQLQILAQNVENRVICGEVADLDGDGKPDIAVADLPGIERLYEAFYEDALVKLPAQDRKKARRLIELGLIFEQDNQRINLHEKLINRDYGVGEKLVQQLIDLRLLRAEPSSSGGKNIELSHDSFVFPILNVARRRRKEQRRKRALALGGVAGILILALGAGSLFSLRNKLPAEVAVIRENVVLTHQLDSIKEIKSQEEQARDLVLRYMDCVNNHDISCISALSADTMERYHQVEYLPRKQREKLERDYFKRHEGEKIEEIKETTVVKADSVYEVTVNATFLYEKQGLTPVIFRIKLNEGLKLYYLRSFIARE